MGTGSTPAPESARKPPRHNIPSSLTSFVGREREILEIRRLLGSSRLLTLTGAGSVGKTRLALEVARTTVGAWPDGVWLVELAALTDSSLIPQAITASLGIREQPDRSLVATLTEHFRDRSLLLILDNCEHLVAACADLAERLVLACPGLRILATSREALGTSGEVLWRVPGLAAPEPETVSGTIDAAPAPAPFEAVSLFHERARATLPDFALTDRSVPLVAEICRQLHGMPLAVELTAARVGVLSPGQIAARLDDQLRLLTNGRRTALRRHQTLRALVDWSHELLPSAERTLFRRLAVFAGGWTLEAAEAVCSGGGIAREEILDLLAQLVAKSLVQVDDQDTEGRYRFLETIRQYAAERLRAAGEEATLRRRHRDWVLALAEEAEPFLLGPEQIRWGDRLSLDLDNIRAALDRSVTARDCAEEGTDDVGLRIAAALLWFWYHWFWYHDRFGEGRQWLERALVSAEAMETPARARALVAAGHLAYYQGDLVRSNQMLGDGLRLHRELGDRRGVAVAQGEATRAARLLGAAEVLRESIGSPVPPVDRADHDRDRAAVRATLDERSFATAWAEGRAMGWREAAEYALEPEPPSSPPAALPKQTPDPWPAMGGSDLSPREREVAMLVARGRKNREIAEELVIGGRTVEPHVTNVLAKLGLRSRSQIAVWVVERGLLTERK